MGVAPFGPRADFATLEPVSYSVETEYGQARAVVKLNNRLYNLKSYAITKTAHGATNTGSCILPYNANPDWTDELFRDESNTSPVYVEIWAGFPSAPSPSPTLNGLQRRFFGIVDQYQPHGSDSTEFALRSIAAPLLSDRIASSVQNMTTVAFIKQICAPYNIPVQIDPKLGPPAPFLLAKVYAQEFMVGLKNLVKWDVILRSSIFDDTDVWEDDGTIYYYQPWNIVRPILPINYGGTLKDKTGKVSAWGVKTFSGIHAPQFSRNVQVQVHTYRAKTRISTTTRVRSLVGGGIEVAQVTRTSVASPVFGQNAVTVNNYQNGQLVSTRHTTTTGGNFNSSTNPISESGREKYDFYIPNLTPEECNGLAQALQRQISMHEYQGQFEIAVTPANLGLLGITTLIDFDGYGMSKFNTQYWPRDMHETFSAASENSDDAQGWTVGYNGVNHTPPQGAV